MKPKNPSRTRRNMSPRRRQTNGGASPRSSEVQPATPNLQPSTGILPHAEQRARNGNVARLPKQIRRQINEMLDDGIPFAQILKNLGEQAQGLRVAHIGSWKSGGYQDYLCEQRLLEKCRLRQNHAFELLSNTDHINGFQATQQLATAQICETIADLGADVLREALIANPLNYFRMLNSFARLTNGGLKCERYVAEDAERKASLEKGAAPGKPRPISAETLKLVEEELNLM